MIIFEIQGVNYQDPETAKDISLQKWVDYLKEIKPLQPEYLQHIYEAETVDEKIREKALQLMTVKTGRS